MIGRHDITFLTEMPTEVMEGTVRLLRASWSEAVVENAETGELLGFDSVRLTELPEELLIYKNSTAQDSWKVNGAIPENENLMIHALRGDQSITIVVDDPVADEMSYIIQAIRDHVYQDIFWIRADAA